MRGAAGGAARHRGRGRRARAGQPGRGERHGQGKRHGRGGRHGQGGNNALSSAFYSQLTSLGVPFDVIGLSYYPFFHGAISAMRANVDALATQFHKPIVIAETQYPWTLANGNSPLGDSTGDFVWQTRARRSPRSASSRTRPTSASGTRRTVLPA